MVKAGWKDEGIGWYSDDSKTIPLYREYNPNAAAGSHNYTTSQDEHSALIVAGWRDEGIGWYALKNGKPNQNVGWLNLYKQIVEKEASNSIYSDRLEYYPLWYLWNNAGYDIPVLVLKTGRWKNEYNLKFFLVQNGSVFQIAEFAPGPNDYFSTDVPGQFLEMAARKNYETITRITLKDDQLNREIISQRYVSASSEYKKPDGEEWVFKNIFAFN